ncbi:MAG: GSCFA domain-containing protein [Chlamydiales bacterium]|nr:GSCFA domain-containing protein [Chlamydiales bacterium]
MITTFSEAIRKSKKNAYRRYCTPRARYGVDQEENTAAHRIQNHNFVAVHHEPKFILSSQNSFFTMGSCFVREIEKFLLQRGLNVLLKDFTIPHELLDESFTGLKEELQKPEQAYRDRSILNKYSPLSMLNELERVLLKKQILNDGLIKIRDDVYFDAQVKNTKNGSKKEALKIRALVENSIEQIRYADCAIFTLGMTETWLDKELDIVQNIHPPFSLLKSHPDRFVFFNQNHENIVSCLKEIVSLLRNQVSKELKIIFTVSPVPLGLTFTSQDAITANCYSKSTLRSAVNQILDEDPLVDYFPSYEIATISNPQNVWISDQTHLKDAAVEFITQHFYNTFFKN